MRADDLKHLGLTTDANADEIRKAYRTRAKELHPDTSSDPQAELKFRELVAAYERLLENNYQQVTATSASTVRRTATYRATRQREQAQLTPRQVFWRKIGRITYRVFTPVLFLILFLLTPLWLMLIPVVPWYLERKRRKASVHH